LSSYARRKVFLICIIEVALIVLIMRRSGTADWKMERIRSGILDSLRISLIAALPSALLLSRHGQLAYAQVSHARGPGAP
jgi:hypothetical protein